MLLVSGFIMVTCPFVVVENGNVLLPPSNVMDLCVTRRPSLRRVPELTIAPTCLRLGRCGLLNRFRWNPSVRTWDMVLLTSDLLSNLACIVLTVFLQNPGAATTRLPLVPIVLVVVRMQLVPIPRLYMEWLMPL